MLYFKVKIGYEPDDVVFIDESEYGMALKAQISGKIAVFKEGTTIGGNSIISISPDYLKMTGYELDDVTNIKEFQDQKKKCIEDVREFLQKSKIEVEKQLDGGTKLLG